MEDLLRYNKQQKYVVFDFETCHLNLISFDNKPWQIGIIDCENEEMVNKYNFFIKWDNLNISPDAARITKFNRKQYEENGTDPIKVLDILENYLYNDEYLIIFHNGLGFDVYIHNYFRKLLNRPTDYSYIDRCLDTNALAKGIKFDIKYQRWMNLLGYQYSMLGTVRKGIKTNLKFLGQEQKIDFDYENLHDGLKDCELNFLVWNKWIKWNVEI